MKNEYDLNTNILLKMKLKKKTKEQLKKRPNYYPEKSKGICAFNHFSVL